MDHAIRLLLRLMLLVGAGVGQWSWHAPPMPPKARSIACMCWNAVNRRRKTFPRTGRPASTSAWHGSSATTAT